MENEMQATPLGGTHPAEAERKNGAKPEAILGKFKDVRDLETAYGALQAEFTKKCQKLKALEGELSDKAEAPPREDAGDKPEQAIAAFLATRKGGERYLLPLGEKLGDKESVTEGEVRDAYLSVLESAREQDLADFYRQAEKIKEDAVRAYVRSVAKTNEAAPVLTDIGQITVAPPPRPRSIEDAGKLAEGLFRQIKL